MLQVDGDSIRDSLTLNSTPSILILLLSASRFYWLLTVWISNFEEACVRIHVLFPQLFQLLLIFPKVQVVKLLRLLRLAWLLFCHWRLARCTDIPRSRSICLHKLSKEVRLKLHSTCSRRRLLEDLLRLLMLLMLLLLHLVLLLLLLLLHHLIALLLMI